MTATLSADFQAHIAGRAHKRCKMLRLDLRDGSVIGFTDHNKPLDFDLGDAAGSITYSPKYGMQMSDIELACGLDAGNCEVTFPISSVIGRAAVQGGMFNRAEARVFEAIWSDLDAGPRKFLFGNCGEWRVEGDKAVCGIRDQRDRLNQTTGRILQNQCDADYADQVRCFAVPTEIEGTVTAVSSAMQFTVSFTGSYADAFFDRGTVYPLTGANANQFPVPIDTWTSAGVIRLFWPLTVTPEVGDTFTIRDGCARTRTACIAHDQIVNFRGFPEVPGTKAQKPKQTPAPSGGKK